MKKYVVFLAATVMLFAVEFNGDWSHRYDVRTNCGTAVTVEHHPDKVCFIDNSNSFLVNERQCFKDRVSLALTTETYFFQPACVAEISLEVDIAQKEFEQKLENAGFKILSSQEIG